MTYTPINVDAYTNAYAGALAGMAISGWIVDPNSADYAKVAAIAGAFAEAFDTVWNNATTLNSLQTQSIQSVCQEQFTGHAPGSLDSDIFTNAANWAVPAAACAALVLEGDAYVASQGITPTTPGGGTFEPIYQQLWLDTTKAAGGNGSIGKPFNTWADTMAPLAGSGSDDPWVIFLAQSIDATGVPLPDIVAGQHANGYVKFEGAVQNSAFATGTSVLSNLVVDPQDNGRIGLEFANIIAVTIQITSGALSMSGSDSVIAGVTQSGTITGSSNLINCSISDFSLDSWDLRMSGGEVSSSMQVHDGILDDVLFLGSCQFRWNGTLTLNNCQFETNVQLLCSSSNSLVLDLDTWGKMVAAGVTFPDTTPTLTIIPWMPIIADKAVVGTTGMNPGDTVLNIGQLVPPAEPGSPCVTGLKTQVNSNLSVVGSFIDNSTGELNVIVRNTAGTSQNLTNPTYTVTYLPRVTP